MRLADSNPNSEAIADPESDVVDVFTWTVIPALPGTRIEWEADWCKEGSIAVHAWLIRIDIIGANRSGEWVDNSCVNGFPMVLSAYGELAPASSADLEGKPGEVIEP